MASLYADENFPLPVVAELRRLGHDVLTIHEDGKANQQYPDGSVLVDASAYGRAVLTLNRKHFKQLHQTVKRHAGIIMCTYDSDFVGQAQRIHEMIGQVEELKGLLMRVNKPAQVSSA